MVRIGGTVIISSMTSYTSIRSIVIIAVMAGSTITGDFSMRSCEDIKLIVSRESSRAPSRSG